VRRKTQDPVMDRLYWSLMKRRKKRKREKWRLHMDGIRQPLLQWWKKKRKKTKRQLHMDMMSRPLLQWWKKKRKMTKRQLHMGIVCRLLLRQPCWRPEKTTKRRRGAAALVMGDARRHQTTMRMPDAFARHCLWLLHS
jgi:hypothetical protein